MSAAAPISPAMNGVRGGRSHRGRGHKRNHGHSINDNSQQVSPYIGASMPSQNVQAPLYLSNSAKEDPPAQYTEKQGLGSMNIPNGGVTSGEYHYQRPSASQDGFSLGSITDGQLHAQLSSGQHEHSHTSFEGLGWSMISGVLTALPFVASYFLTSISAGRANARAKSTEKLYSHRLALSPLLVSCAYVAVALLLQGIYEKLRPGRRKATPAQANGSNLYDGLRMALWMSLLFYASFMVGFDVVVAVLLLRLSADVPAGSRSNNMLATITHIFKQRKISTLFIIAMAALDTVYLSSSDPITPSSTPLSTSVNATVDEKFASGKNNIDDAATVNLVIGMILGALVILNLVFMMVQLTYGIVTGSLGLLSDSIHMLFDCFALAVGLAAAVMSKWPPSSRFPYGYGKIDTLAGFGNGVFLMIISIEIVYEAVERLMSGSEVHRIGDLFIVSSLGLVVNLVGIFAFDHAHHGHGHGGHDHDHGHGNENMHGIFLHILADALGSVAVVSSTILVHFFGWSGFDPIASCLIAILIFASAIPLVISTSKTLLLALPADVEYSLRDTLASVSVMRGVVGYTVPKFWLDDTVHDHNHKHHDHSHGHTHRSHHGHNHDHWHDHGGSHNLSNHSCNSHSHSETHSHSHGHAHSHSEHEQSSHRRVLGVIHIIASKNSDLSDVHARVASYLSERGMNVLVQVEREGDIKCWCGGGNRTAS
ncbi:CDF zinc transporter [Microsporum canis CBS 113480]|uniref:Zinc transporter n=1 Tax=Arthroderma otae (strain ATCC MYA-4605 / CBS 113480) TaxID=554155 RepID=C5FWP3_ARTOC|nr:CDF zinc transporter [Microsporum canis CBS 113480]EEQ34327.1 CDF zinc transporter [Microsporum canis CBS 113480]